MKIPTRQRLVEAAIRRFYRDGFRSVGVDQILADIGISKTAFYKHFQSKEDLMLAGLEMQNRWLQDTFRTVIRERGGPSAIGQLNAVLDVVESLIESDEFQGCIFVNAAMEFPLPHEPAHVAASRNKQAIEDIVCALAREAGAVGTAPARPGIVLDHGRCLCYPACHGQQADNRYCAESPISPSHRDAQINRSRLVAPRSAGERSHKNNIAKM